MKLSIQIPLLIFVLALLSACTQSTKPDNQLIMQAQTAEQSGDIAAAAKLYSQLATETIAGDQATFYYRAATAYWTIHNSAMAEASLAKINFDLLPPLHKVDARLLQAEIALSNQRPEQAINAVTSYPLTDASQAQIIKTLNFRIEAYQLTKNWLETANSYILLATYLPEDQRLANQQKLWQALMKLTPQALDLFNPSYPPAIDSGWFALAYLIKSYQDNPEAMKVAFKDWKIAYPNHPADPSLYRDILMASTQLPQSLDNIVVLLPTTGPYAEAASAIKQGLIAEHYSEQSPTHLYFLDVATDKVTGKSNVWQRYEEAITLNANLVIGPLDKESIEILAAADSLPIPVLALNRVNEGFKQHGLFQFGLAPEDDAAAAAHFASEQGYKRAIILAPNTAWGTRVANAFSNQWRQHDGVILKNAHYSERDNDFATVITPLFGLDSSEQRARSLKNTLKTSIEFEPRRRADIDFIFLIARPSKARQLMPQLKFHRSGTLPIIATSHAYAGYEDLRQNIDLDKLIINDIPWIFENTALTDSTYITLKNNTDINFKNNIRLYALGVDAYRLTLKLNQLSHNHSMTLHGATGDLSIDDSGIIRRKMIPATFKRAKIVPLIPTKTAITEE